MRLERWQACLRLRRRTIVTVVRVNEAVDIAHERGRGSRWPDLG